MDIVVNKARDKDEYYFEEGCYILELSNTTQDPHVSIARARVLPGTCTRLHRLKGIIERYVILQGSGEAFIGNDTVSQMSIGDVVTIPEGYSQMIRNTGKTDLIFLAICTPRFTKEAYQSV